MGLILKDWFGIVFIFFIIIITAGELECQQVSSSLQDYS